MRPIQVCPLPVGVNRIHQQPDENALGEDRTRGAGFYLADPEPDATRPAGSAGATHDPAELLHLVLDVLERVRV